MTLNNYILWVISAGAIGSEIGTANCQVYSALQRIFIKYHSSYSCLINPCEMIPICHYSWRGGPPGTAPRPSTHVTRRDFYFGHYSGVAPPEPGKLQLRADYSHREEKFQTFRNRKWSIIHENAVFPLYKQLTFTHTHLFYGGKPREGKMVCIKTWHEGKPEFPRSRSLNRNVKIGQFAVDVVRHVRKEYFPVQDNSQGILHGCERTRSSLRELSPILLLSVNENRFWISNDICEFQGYFCIRALCVPSIWEMHLFSSLSRRSHRP